MKNNLKKKNLTKIGLFSIFTILASFSCRNFSYAEIFEPVPIASNSIYLDSSKVPHPILDISSIPTPSEYKHGKRSVLPAPPQTLPEVFVETKTAEEEKEFTPFAEMDAFAPPSQYVPEYSYTKTSTESENIYTEVKEETLSPNIEEYYASATEDNTPEINYEGKIISGIQFRGLNLIKEELLKAAIQTKNGSAFNSSTLQNDLQRIYALGYFTDIMNVEPELNDDDTINLCFTVEENIEVKDVSITGNTVFTTIELMQYVKNLKGLPQNLSLINESIEKINNHYHEKGYILANVSFVDDNENGELILGINEGKIDKIVFEGNNKTKDYIIERNILTQPETVYNEEIVKKDLARVFATQIFDDVERDISPSTEKEGEYTVTIKVKEASSNNVSIGAGIDNALGVFGSVGYNEKNFMGRGQRVSLMGMVGSGVLLSDASIKNRMNYNLELNFFEPYFINADNSLSAKIFYRDLGSYQVPLAIERRFGVNAVAEHKVAGYDNLSTNLGIGYEHIQLKEGDESKIAELYKKSKIPFSKREKELTGGSFLNISPGVKYSTLDNDTMPREGIIAKASYIEALGLSNIHHTNGRLAGGVTKYFPVAKKSTFSLGARGGMKVHGKDMPEVMAFRLGGPYSIRGFKMNGVGTGESFLMGSAELQTPIPLFDKFKYDILKNMRFAFFMDAGKVFNPTISSELYDRPLSAITAGIGLRVYIPGLGPISVDYGIPITNPGHYGNTGGYFTFGTGGLYDSY